MEEATGSALSYCARGRRERGTLRLPFVCLTPAPNYAIRKEVRHTMLYRDNQGGALARRPQGTLSRPQGSALLSRFDPLREMEEVHRQMDDLFSRVFGSGLPDLAWSRGQGL